MDTKAKFLEYTDKVILDEDTRDPIDGDVLKDGVIYRFKNGKLHGEGEPAIATEDGHLEYWKEGKLHADEGPAVCSITEDINGNKYEEFWKDGERIS